MSLQIISCYQYRGQATSFWPSAKLFSNRQVYYTICMMLDRTVEFREIAGVPKDALKQLHIDAVPEDAFSVAARNIVRPHVSKQ